MADPEHEYVEDLESIRQRHEAEEQHMKLSLQNISGGVQINKYLRIALSVILTAVGGLLFLADNVNWNGLLGPKSGAAIVMIIGLIKIAYAALAPSPSQNTVATGNPIVTQVAVGPNPAGPSNPHA